MGGCCSRPQQLVVAVMGVSGSGKSAVVAMLSGAGPGSSAGQGTDIVDVESSTVSLRLLDLPGAEHSHSGWKSAMQECHAAVYVVDCGDRARLEQAGYLLNSSLESAALRGKPVVVCAHKQDVLGCLTPSQVVDALNLHAVTARPWTLVPTSHSTGEGADRIVAWLLQQF